MPTTFQTVQLGAGRHDSPASGACVMELASMLAGERFTDHPRSVCNVVAMVLRGYNDGVDNERRQDLYRYAAAAVGTSDRRVRRERLRRCEEFFGVRRRPSLLVETRLRSVGRHALTYANLADDADHRRFIRFVDELIGAQAAVSSPPRPRLSGPLRRRARRAPSSSRAGRQAATRAP